METERGPAQRRIAGALDCPLRRTAGVLARSGNNWSGRWRSLGRALWCGAAAGGDARGPATFARFRALGMVCLCPLLVAVFSMKLQADERTFALAGENVRLQDVSADVEVRYQAMRFNRAAGTWNVEVFVTNKGNRALQGPFVFYVTGFSNTSGPQQPDGTQEGQPFFDLNAQVADGTLSPAEASLPRTLTLGRTTGWVHRAELQRNGVKMIKGVEYRRIDDAGVHVAVDGKESVLPADTVVLCAGQEPKRELKASHLIGGAKAAGELDAKRAMLEGAELAASL